MRCLLGVLALVPIVGCRSQTTAMTNPFMAPDRVPPPATRTLLPGTAQPYYPGDPVPNASAIGAPPIGYPSGFQQPTPTYAPQPAGTVPPGGWNGAPQSIPGGSSSYQGLPNSVQPASAELPITGRSQIQVPQDQQNLRFPGATPVYQPPSGALPPPSTFTIPTATSPTLRPDPSVLPTPQQVVSPYPNQLASYQVPIPPPQYLPQAGALGETRDVRIRAVSSPALNANNGESRSSDGFRPRGSSQVRKPTLASRLVPRKRPPIDAAIGAASDRFGFDPQFGWLRGELQYSAQSGLWSLRYGPGQSSEDRFGGSMTIANPQVLGNLQPGEFLQLSGSVSPSRRGGTPAFRVSVVRRQRI